MVKEHTSKYCKRGFNSMNRVVLVIGGNGGIGSEVSKLFSEHDYSVIIAGRDVNTSQDDLIGETKVKYIAWDLSKTELIKDKVNEAIRLFGEINIVINCAGCLFPTDRTGEFFNVTINEWESVHRINLEGIFFVCQAVTEYWIREGIKGHIVNVCSEMGFRATWTPYGISKWGVRGLTYGLGRYFAPYGIVINGIAPGQTATKIVGYHEGDSLSESSIPRGIMATPKEIASEIFFLATDNNIIGEVLISDGARHLR